MTVCLTVLRVLALRVQVTLGPEAPQVLISGQHPSVRDTCHTCPRISEKSLPEGPIEWAFPGDLLLINLTVPKAGPMLFHSLYSPKSYLLFIGDKVPPHTSASLSSLPLFSPPSQLKGRNITSLWPTSRVKPFVLSPYCSSQNLAPPVFPHHVCVWPFLLSNFIQQIESHVKHKCGADK